ncbi:MAG: indole-3-glycerol phosphate synthase TrpC [Longimicrobiales bacterium]
MSVLERIVEQKRAEVGRLREHERTLRQTVERAAPVRSFERILRARDDVAVIAEFKRRSPSAGWIRQDASAVEYARAYARAGAAALSVLTDEVDFGGALADLEQARAAVTLPVLRKDFILDEVQLLEARGAGADAVLLIVRMLEPARLGELLAASAVLGMAALVEVHDEGEIEAAIDAGARIIGINNRDLASFQTDVRQSLRLASLVPAAVVLVAESGIQSAADVVALGAAGVDAVLVGEWAMRRGGPGLRALVGHTRAQRAGSSVAAADRG